MSGRMRSAMLMTCAAIFSASAPAGSVKPGGQAALEPELAARLSAMRPKDRIDVIVVLRNQPAALISREVQESYRPIWEAVAEQARVLASFSRPAHSMRPEEERAFMRTFRPDAVVPANVLQQLDAVRDEMLRVISRRLELAVRDDQALVALEVRRLGGKVRGAMCVLNSLAASLTAKGVLAITDDPRVATVWVDHPGAPELNVSAPSLGAPSFWNAGNTGNPFDCGVLDTGVQQNHPAFAGHRFESNAGVTDSNGHGTAMAGIMSSVDATNRGIAWGLDTISVAIAGADATSMSGMNYLMTGVTERAENVNYSFGNGTANDTDYGSFDKFMDGVCDTFLTMVSKSTGNNGWGTTTITHPAPAYNLLASANMNDNNTLSRTDDRINSSSSRGPTLGGRKKPDISAPGTSIVSPTPSGGWAGVTGTSPASPHTGGSIILLCSRGTVDPIAGKAVLLNTTDAINDNNTSSTADDTWVAGSHWNKTYGWGYLNLSQAFLHATDVFVRNFAAPVGGARRFMFFKGQMFANEKATLTWNRHVAFNGAAYPTVVEDLSNLDLVAYAENTNAQLASSTSTIDNVEQLSVGADAMTVLKVYTVGPFDPQVTTERWALATQENFAQATGPVLEVTVLLPGEYAINSQAPVQASVRNLGDLTAHGVSLQLVGVSTTGSNTVNMGSVAPGEIKLATWTAIMPPTAGEYQLTVNGTSVSYGETFTGAGSAAMTVGGELGLVALAERRAGVPRRATR